jgi:hypothetical protein
MLSLPSFGSGKCGHGRRTPTFRIVSVLNRKASITVRFSYSNTVRAVR